MNKPQNSTRSASTTPTSTGPTGTASASTGPTRRPVPGSTSNVGELRAERSDTAGEPVDRGDVPTRLREKRTPTTERVQEQVAHPREVAAERAPTVQSALRERPAAVGGTIAAVLGWLLLRALRRRRAHRKAQREGTR